MAPPLLHLRDIALTFGGTPLLTGAELALAPGERIALVGRNGSGKSTLLRIAAGSIAPDGGEVFVQPGATVRYLPQEPDLSAFGSIEAYVADGLAPGDDRHRAERLIERLGLAGGAAPATLSGGEARRAALARTLAPQPDILLLDEPTNHLDLPAIEWLESELKALRSAMVIISHDRRFLENLTGATVWLDRGESRRLDRGFGAFESWRDKLLEEEELARHKLDRQIVREEHWLRYGVTARRKRNVGRLERLAQLRETRRTALKRTGAADLQVVAAKTSGAIVVDAEGIAKSYDDKTIVRPLDLRVLRGERLGIVGANGAGKTTLVKLLTGRLAPDSGRIKLGTNLEMAWLDQSRQSLDPAMPLRDALTGGAEFVEVNGARKHFAALMQDFLFAPEQAGTPVSRLSGGERARLTLARALIRPSNLLVLDEPTNDLDIETLDLLQELVADYAGTAIVVSHDRDFLDRVATSILASEGDGRWVEYAGGYKDMLAQRTGRADAMPSAKPAKKAEKPAAPKAAPAANRPKKLSFNQAHALKTLPDRLAGLEKTIAKAEAELADPALYARDPDRFARLSAELTKAQTEHTAAEEQWLELELLREELEG